LLPYVGVAIQNIPVAIDLERHAAIYPFVTGRNIILVHNEERAHLKQFLDLLHLKLLVRSALDSIVTARNGAHSCKLLAVLARGYSGPIMPIIAADKAAYRVGTFLSPDSATKHSSCSTSHS